VDAREVPTRWHRLIHQRRHTVAATRAALDTPIDFADLERRRVLKHAKDSLFVLLLPKALPAYRRGQGSVFQPGSPVENHGDRR
jgi:hypothetical protein